ncbi:zinc finger C3HC-type protein 1-like isoform X2 [Clavelina lepadiformis]|uniref:zinc finger C3HC-type protein 1-like isoform X2 n=1 Tax=Clavelina lepadiformis TaxID=159417 RepID=UPI004041B817
MASTMSPVNIPTAMRPSKSVVDLVKNVMSDLISSLENEGSTDESENVNNSTVDCRDKSVDLDKSQVQNETSEIKPTPSPRSKEAFQKRVKTFTSSLWCGKPLSLSPPLLAQYGWECIGEDIAKCCTCSVVIAVRLPWPNKDNYRSECEKAQENVIRGHLRICSWPSNYCSDVLLHPFDDVQYLSIQDKLDLKKKFFKRFENLMSLREKLPVMTAEVHKDMNLNEDVICQFLDESSSEDEELLKCISSVHDKVKISAALLALCGWDASFNLVSGNPGVECEETGRTIGLWNFHSISDEDNDFQPTPAKKQRHESLLVIKKQFFHPVNQHHVWSPWVTTLSSLSAANLIGLSSSVVNEDKPAGWKIVRDFLLPVADLSGANTTPLKSGERCSMKNTPYKTPPAAAVQRAMKMLDEWSSPHHEAQNVALI